MEEIQPQNGSEILDAPIQRDQKGFHGKTGSADPVGSTAVRGLVKFVLSNNDNTRIRGENFDPLSALVKSPECF